MRIDRFFTAAGKSPYEGVAFRTATSEIRNPDGSVVFEMKDVLVPETWSQVAVDILAQKYFRRTGVPKADGSTGGESSIKQVAHRLDN